MVGVDGRRNDRGRAPRIQRRGATKRRRNPAFEATRSVARTLLHTEVYGLRTDKSGKTIKVLRGAGDADAPPSELEGDEALRTHQYMTDDTEEAAASSAKGRDVADDMRRGLNDQFTPQGVQITDVIITDVQLPDQIVQQMSEKTGIIAQVGPPPISRRSRADLA